MQHFGLKFMPNTIKKIKLAIFPYVCEGLYCYETLESTLNCIMVSFIVLIKKRIFFRVVLIVSLILNFLNKDHFRIVLWICISFDAIMLCAAPITYKESRYMTFVGFIGSQPIIIPITSTFGQAPPHITIT